MKVIVAHAQDFHPGERRIITAGKRSIGVFRIGDRYYAVRNSCPHQSGPLCEGPVFPGLSSRSPGTYEVDDERWYVACPWHGWEYDLETGQSWFDPAKSRVRSYDVGIESGACLTGAAAAEEETGRVRGPYTAELFPVSVEDDYVVVDVPG